MAEEDTLKAGYIHCTGVLESQSMARDVKIGAFALSAYGKELIKDTSIEFTIGKRYGLIGLNGSGKSSFLKCIADRQIPIPDHIDMFFLDEEQAPSETSALNTIVNEATAEIERLEKEQERILVEDGPDSLLLADINDRLEEMEPEQMQATIAKLLHGLGFSSEMMNKATKDMSGGCGSFFYYFFSN